MALARAWKHIYAVGDDVETARRLYARIQTRFAQVVARGSPIRGQIICDEPDEFNAITNCGWQWLELEAWALGRPGVRRYITTMADWDDDTVSWITEDAQQISGG